MNEETAKKLIEAQFPFDWKYSLVPTQTNGASDEHKMVISKYPTLSELIEACGDYFVLLIHNPLRHEWIAGDTMPGKKAENYGEGSTPEEAVANLWLALSNSK